MLQKLNERIQGVIAWVIIVLIAITFTLFGVDYYLQSRQSSNYKVTVNDEPISVQDFDTNYRRARSQQDLAQLSAKDEKNLQNQVLNQMITNEVSVQSARLYGFEVSPAQANAAIINIPQFQEDGHFSTERYQQALSGALFTPETFQKEVRQGMLLNQQRYAFMGTSFALPEEIKRFVRLYMQTRDYDYLTVPSVKFEKQAQISDEEIKNYYEKNSKQFMTEEHVSIDYVLLSMSAIKSKLKISDKDIASYYEENKSNYLTPAQWQVAHILFSIPETASDEEASQAKANADKTYKELQADPSLFDKFVATKSDDKLSMKEKGLLPWITGGQSEYAKDLSLLDKPGQISNPIKTKYGYEIFKLIAYKPVTTKSLDQVSTIIKEQLLNDMAQAKYAKDLEELTDISYQTPDSLEPVANSLKLPLLKSKPFSRQGGKDTITENKQVINAAFSNDVLELSNNSDPIQLNNDAVIVLRVNKHIPARQEKLIEVRNEIQKILAKQHGEEKAKEIGTSLLNPVEDDKQIQLMDNNNLKWETVAAASRDGDKTNSLINDTAFNLLRPESRNGVQLLNGDYVVVRLKKINDGNLESLDEEQKDSLVQQIEASYGMMDYDLYIKNLLNNAKIVRK
ncbi:SurA N-terminal domain-containing protein [Legionella waltersii]|uniref:Periplasmic chaperone PpiD n=1 Tax=Legionella waltersii TaxID=66969 RepID=A0A0W1A1L0_9GAMM|nr:SurA N-terminal domain-containing protein [Legionella waltersii]KTD75260.1 peptidyl-prolyl cis-trans isomerase D [Legionella waltersii]SNV06771.1 peptidyl-prolyl cis-trans isomerase D [Legionella waltersii]